MKGYLDRIEDGGKAVIVREELGFEIILPVRDLPEGSSVNSWFRISEENDGFSFVLDEEERNRREQLAKDMTRKLRMNGSDSKYKRQ